METPHPRWVLAIVLFVTFVVFSPTLKFDFVSDDRPQIDGNPRIHSWRFVGDYFTSSVWAHRSTEPGFVPLYYRPVFLLWFLINYTLFGSAPLGWHFTTLAVHLIATALLYWLALKLTQDSIAAGYAALLFGIHPAHVEAVAWVSGVTEPLVTVFFLAAFLCYLNSRVAASLCFFAAALLEKETAIVLPFVILAFVWLFRPPARIRNLLMETAPYLAVALTYLLVRVAILKRISHVMTPLPAKTLLFTWPSLLWFYVKHLLWPVNLSLFYDLPYITRPALASFVLPCLALVGIGVSLWLWSRRSRLAGLASVWMVVAILPALNITGFTGGEIVHDRYLYLPSVGFALLVMLGIRKLQIGRVSQLAGAAVLVMLLGSLTVSESRPWADDETLFRYGLMIAPRNLIAAHELGVELLRKERPQEAIPYLRESLARRSDYKTLTALAVSYFKVGRREEAETYFQQSLKLNPAEATSYFYLAVIRFDQKRLADAEESMRKAIALESAKESPDFAFLEWHYNLAIILRAKGDLAGAVKEFQEELNFNPDSDKTYRELAKTKALLKESGTRK